MDSSFPSSVDVILIGTGLTETILSAAFSRAGKTVLHLDSNKHYGREWASFTFADLYKWIEEERESNNHSLQDVEVVSFLPESLENGDECKEKHLTIDYFKTRLSNKFSIDLAPRMLFSQGPMVELLVKSNICRYLEFKKCTRLLHLNIKSDNSDEASSSNYTFEKREVPCTRENVFSDRSLSLVQKRKLMKFIDNCQRLQAMLEENQEQVVDSLMNLSFDNFLLNQEVGKDETLRQFLHCVAVSDVSSPRDFLKMMSLFLQSAGKYGNTPFLWTLYGCGELPQAFSRLSAVFGGLFCLGQKVESVEVENDNIQVTFNSHQVCCKILIGSLSSLPSHLIANRDSLEVVTTCHAICLTDRSLYQEDGTPSPQHISFGRMPCQLKGKTVTVIELSEGSLCVPRGFCLVYFSCLNESSEESARQFFTPLLDKIFDITHQSQGYTEQSEKPTTKPSLLWALFFTRQTTLDMPHSVNPDRISIVKGPVNEQDYESSINEARRIFHHHFPDEDFLPRAPDAEDIIMEGDDDGEDEQPSNQGQEQHQHQANEGE